MTRNLYSGQSENYPSRFLLDIPKEMVEELTPVTRMPRKERASAPATPVFFRQAEFKPQAQADAGQFSPGMTVEHKKVRPGEN